MTHAAADSALTPALRQEFDRARDGGTTAPRNDAGAMRAHTVRMYGRLAAVQDEVISRRALGIDCAKGCSYCCHLRVEVRPHEAFVLAHHLQARLAPAARDAALARLDANLARIASLSPAQHRDARIPCAFLVEGACSVYEARPAACRKYHSVSLATCKAAYDAPAAPLTGVIEDDELRFAGNAVALGHAKGLEDAGLDATLYELHGAVRKALDNPKAEKRWRDGKKPFV